MSEPVGESQDFSTRIAAAYASEGATVDIGRAVLDGTTFPKAVVAVPTAMCNRHGLIAGATGTGKTVTLQLLAEQLSAQGVAVFTADIKGDLTGLAKPSTPGEKVQKRIDELGLTYAPTGSPVQFWSLGGQGPGVPLRATIGAFGPQLLAKVLGANETQTSSLALVFYYADQKGLPLLDLVDLVDLLTYLISDDGKAELKTIGGLSSATAGVLLRKLVELTQQDAEAFFGEPEVTVDALIRTAPDGRGIVNCLELAAVQDRPKLFSTFLMWLLAELFETLPEVGDLDRPKLVFFFDEAHLLFADASKEFVDQVAQTVRLIRSKGVGVFFITQLPDDVPDAVLAQLGNRVQHALRSYTPRDAKALKAAVSTYPKTGDYDLEEALTQLGIGEAIVTTLSDDGAPTPVAWTKVRPPQSQIGAVDPAEVDALARASELWATYATEIDRRSARELLAAKMGVEPPSGDDFQVTVPDERHGPPARKKGTRSGPPARSRSTSRSSPKKQDAGNPIVDFLKSREGRATVNNVARGVFGMMKKR